MDNLWSCGKKNLQFQEPSHQYAVEGRLVESPHDTSLSMTVERPLQGTWAAPLGHNDTARITSTPSSLLLAKIKVL